LQSVVLSSLGGQLVRVRGLIALTAVVLVAGLVASSCSSGDDDSSDSEGLDADDGGSDDRGSDDETTTTEPADEPTAAEPDQVVPYLEDLLARYDAAVNEIVADPSVAGDSRDPATEEFLSLFEVTSEFAAGSVEGWMSQAEQGIVLEPASPDRGVNTTTLEGPPTRIDDDTIMFGHCTIQSYVVVEDGAETRREDRRLLPGTGQAVRVDGHWLLEEITTPPDTQGCITQGGVGGGSG
jgi:hypothetical protein